jgi:hypothetical protein
VARPTSPEKRAEIERDLRARWGKASNRTFAAQHGVSDATIRKIAGQIGLTSDGAREQTQKATERKRATFAQQRAEIAQMMLDAAREALAEIGRGSVVTGISFGEVVCRRVPHTTARDRQALHVAAGIALDKHRMLDQYDSDTDTTDVVKFLNALGGAVAKAAETDA